MPVNRFHDPIDLKLRMGGEEDCTNNLLKFQEDGASSIDFKSSLKAGGGEQGVSFLKPSTV